MIVLKHVLAAAVCIASVAAVEVTVSSSGGNDTGYGQTRYGIEQLSSATSISYLHTDTVSCTKTSTTQEMAEYTLSSFATVRSSTARNILSTQTATTASMRSLVLKC